MGRRFCLLCLALAQACGTENSNVVEEIEAASQELCVADFTPTFAQTTANEWWVEYTIGNGAIASAYLEVPTLGQVSLSLRFSKWSASPSFRVPRGTSVILHATTTQGQAAQSVAFRYLVDTKPMADACTGNVCTPQCGERSCGDDGCGGSCGTCASGQSCNQGVCSAPPPTGTCTFQPTIKQGPGAGTWWVEYAITGGATSARLEVPGRGDVALSSAYGKWVGSTTFNLANGTSVVLHVGGAAGAAAKTEPFAYRVQTQPASVCETGAPPPATPPPATPPPATPPPATPPPAGTDLLFTVDDTARTTPISPFIYGTNTLAKVRTGNGTLTLARASGNRYSTYNWETNASNGGVFASHQNDTRLDVYDHAPAAPLRQTIDGALAVRAGAIVTVPTMGWVAADTKGVVQVGEPRTTRFLPSLPNKSGALAATPDLTDGVVYADELVNYIATRYPQAFTAGAAQVFFCLDNEPSLWLENFPRAYFDPPRIATLLDDNLTYGAMVKQLVPGAFVLGGVLYGWDDFLSYQGAADRDDPAYRGRSFLEIYLAAMSAGEASAGHRLIDALDIHWYPEARGDNVRITTQQSTAGIVSARLQAPRSLWDPTYVETSWITRDSLGNAPIRLLPWLKELIDRNYPGTKLVISEYNYGGGDDISGALAEADVLGIFGRDGVYGAALWELEAGGNPYIYGGMAMYRDYDGLGAHFGDSAVSVKNSNAATSSVYAALDSQTPGTLTLVVINKESRTQTTRIQLGSKAYHRGVVYTLSAGSALPRAAGTLTSDGDGAFSYQLPAMSVSTLVLSP